MPAVAVSTKLEALIRAFRRRRRLAATISTVTPIGATIRAAVDRRVAR